jgi:hypothetical protein
MLDMDYERLLNRASLLVTPTLYKEGVLYPQIPTYNSNGDFSVTRATTATRVNAAGLVELVPYNLLTYSEQFNNVAWTAGSSSITPNAATSPIGTLTADRLTADGANFPHFASQNSTLSANSFTYSVYVKADTNNFFQIRGFSAFGAPYANFNLSSGVVGTTGAGVTSSISSAGNGWYRCTMTFTSLAATSGIGLYIVTNASATPGESNTLTTSVFLWGAQLVEGTSALDYQATETRLNIPRLDYSLGSCPNILLEPQRTNLNTFSEEFNNATFWLRGTGVSVNANTSNSPSGTLTADTITGATGPFVWTGAGTFFRAYTGMSVSTAYTFSAYLKGTGSVTMTWRDGTTGGNNSLVCNLTSSWQRFEITRTTGAATLSMAIVFHSASGNFDAWGGQMELGAYATSYIPTSSASVTRNADVISRGNIFTNGLITASGGTWFVDFRNNRVLTRDSTGLNIYLATNTSVSDGFFFATNPFGSRLRIVRNPGFNVLFDTTTDTAKIAIKWNGTTADIFVNGVKVVSNHAYTQTLFQALGGDGGGVPKYINSMALFPTPLTDGECSMLTSGIYTPALAYAQLGLVSESPACLDSSVNALL